MRAHCLVLIAVVSCVAGCTVDVDKNPFVPAINEDLIDDGEPCDDDGECASGSCAKTMPVSPYGLCWSDAAIIRVRGGCILALVFDTWAEAPCAAMGRTVALCGDGASAALEGRCTPPEVSPAGEYPYPYTCCETTLFE